MNPILRPGVPMTYAERFSPVDRNVQHQRVVLWCGSAAHPTAAAEHDAWSLAYLSALATVCAADDVALWIVDTSPHHISRESVFLENDDIIDTLLNELRDDDERCEELRRQARDLLLLERSKAAVPLGNNNNKQSLLFCVVFDLNFLFFISETR